MPFTDFILFSLLKQKLEVSGNPPHPHIARFGKVRSPLTKRGIIIQIWNQKLTVEVHNTKYSKYGIIASMKILLVRNSFSAYLYHPL